MTLQTHPLWRLFSALCAIADDLETSGVPVDLTMRLDRIIDACCGVMLQQAGINALEGRCPYCGTSLDDNEEAL